MFFHEFKEDVSNIEIPKTFTYPFYYDPHPLCKIAAKQVQDYIENQTEWEHPFSVQKESATKTKAIGKMFGVLVVKNKNNQLGFLSGFSGKLAGTNQHSYFVPPVYDMLVDNSFFLIEETKLNSINAKIEELERNEDYLQNIKLLEQTNLSAKKEITALRTSMIEAKKTRKAERLNSKESLTEKEYALLLNSLAKQSVEAKSNLKQLQKTWDSKIEDFSNSIKEHKNKIDSLKKERKAKSNALQQKLFKQYEFLNAKNETKHLLNLFKTTAFETPPAGAGECAAPKLLQYAFKHQLTLVCMAEFWWGDAPKSEIRKHGQYYPACQGKCKPILTHMLEGVSVDPNPLMENPAIGKELTVEYEDDDIVVVNKPAEFLSVPGKDISDSVYLRMKQKYPNATGPLIVHRLDMSTSGLMIIAKNKEVHDKIQSQFIKREIKKKYVALLDGVPKEDEKWINLPLRLDINDRPRQLVCYEHGKSARTRWEIIETKNNKTKVYFYPVTGRTHQLRVHAAHKLGLGCPIIGDDLYGQKSNRLHLHAESITFFHPKKKTEISVVTKPDF